MKSSSMLIVALTVCCMLSNQALSQTTKTSAGSNQPKEKTLNIGVIGASVSAGFGSDYNLAEAISAAMHTPHKTSNAADNFFFFNPKKNGKKVVEQMISQKVDVVIALDYLFWFASGQKSREQRIKDVTEAIEFLDKLKVPVMVGTVPAMKNVNMAMLNKNRIATSEDVAAINAHLVKLLAKRPSLRSIPLAVWIDKLNANETVPGIEEITDQNLGKSDLFLKDGLHLNRKGLVFGAAMIVAEMKKQKVIFTDQNATNDVATILEVLATKENDITIQARGQDGKLLRSGILRFALPNLMDPRILKEADLELNDLIKLRNLRQSTEPHDLSTQNPYTISGIPPIVSKLKIRVRAEGPNQTRSAWKVLDLGKKNKKILTLRIKGQTELHLRILDDKTGEPLSGAKVVSMTEAKNLGRNPSRLRADFLAQGTTQEDGKVAIGAISPESQDILVTTGDGIQHKFSAIKPSKTVQELRIGSSE